MKTVPVSLTSSPKVLVKANLHTHTHMHTFMSWYVWLIWEILLFYVIKNDFGLLILLPHLSGALITGCTPTSGFHFSFLKTPLSHVGVDIIMISEEYCVFYVIASSNFTVCGSHLGILLQCRFWFSSLAEDNVSAFLTSSLMMLGDRLCSSFL